MASSIFIPQGYQSHRSCGYCKRDHGSAIYGIHAYAISTQDYQTLMDHGFRRSSSFLYKPDLRNSCCPQYCIRLEASKFKPSKEHRQGLNRFSRFILGTALDEKLHKINGRKMKEFNLLDAVHRAEYDTIPESLLSEAPPDHKLVVTLEPASYTEEKFYLYKHYQTHCHKEEEFSVDSESFERFLCSNSFTVPKDGHENGLRMGAWHQCYYIDSQLVAMGVIDFLPNSISAVYFMWHSDLAQYGFGKLSACREIALAIEEQRQYYYLGLYIDKCQKMKYKASFHPSQLLDPILNKFLPFERFQEEFSKGKSFVTFADADDEDSKEVVTNEKDDDFPDDDEGSNLFEMNMAGVLSQDQVVDNLKEKDVTVFFRHQLTTLNDIHTKYTRAYRLIKEKIVEMTAVIGIDMIHEVITYIF
ncbi:arginine-tRNA-protein transferase [Dipodascopsis uninucleata]